MAMWRQLISVGGHPGENAEGRLVFSTVSLFLKCTRGEVESRWSLLVRGAERSWARKLGAIRLEFVLRRYFSEAVF